MEVAYVVGFILLGIVLIAVEILFVPGTTVVGIGGVICAAYGIYLSFETFGTTGGIITLVSSSIVALLLLVVAFKSRSWELFSLKGTMTGVVNEEHRLLLKVGDEGKTISSLKPFGKALFQDKEIEVSSLGGFIEEKQNIRVAKVDNQKIYVEKVNA